MILLPTPGELREARRNSFLLGALLGAALGAFSLGVLLEELGRICR